jgi:hypothetical protein
MKALIDADGVVYGAGCASDQRIYTVQEEEFKYKKEAQKYCKFHSVSEEEIEFRIEPEPVEYCLSSVKKMIKSIMEAVDAEECQLYLGGKDNYREKVAVTLPYKGQRSREKPTHYQAIRDYLVKYWNAIIVDGQEADDAVSIAQCKATPDISMYEEGAEWIGDHTTVVCSKDKDLLSVPGWNYTWQEGGTLRFISLREANNFFYRQLLTGDSVDNILGCGKREAAIYKTGKKVGQTYMKRKGIGPKQAEKLLPMYKNEEEMYKEVKKQYDIVFEDDAERALRENADLLYIRRVEGLSWIEPEETDDA